MDDGSPTRRQALRRVALRALSSPLPTQSLSVTAGPARSLATHRSPIAPQWQASVASRVPRRWVTDEARRLPEDEPAPETTETTEADVPLRSEPLPEEISRTPLTSPSHSASPQQSNASTGPWSTAPRARREYREIPPSATIYVGNLFYDITEADLRREFERIAPVKSVSIVFDRRGLSKGHGYIEYDSIEDAKQAVDQLNQQVFEGRRMIVNFRAPIVAPRPSYRAPASEATRTLYIGNMSFDMTDQDLNDLFRDIRNVIDVRVAIDRRTGTPKGFAHADFTDVESAQQAHRILQSKRLYGRQLRVDFSANASIDRNSPTIRGSRSESSMPEGEPENVSH